MVAAASEQLIEMSLKLREKRFRRPESLFRSTFLRRPANLHLCNNPQLKPAKEELVNFKGLFTNFANISVDSVGQSKPYI